MLDYLHRPQNSLFHEKSQQMILKKISPLLAQIIREGNLQNVFNNDFPEETAEMAVLIISGFIDSNLREALPQRIEALLYNLEKMLGAKRRGEKLYKDLTPLSCYFLLFDRIRVYSISKLPPKIRRKRMIEFKNVSKSYEEAQVVKELSFCVNSGEFFVIVGPSGSGKTTLLKMINKLIEPTAGNVYFDGVDLEDMDLRELRLDIGYVLQQGSLFPNMTVGENIELIPELNKWSKERREEESRKLLKKVGLSPELFYDRYPDELSGGEQQRVGIVRAMVTSPKILLMDEPFSALDPVIRRDLQNVVKSLHEEFATTVVFVTHDMREAVKLADRVCVMRLGEILQLDEPGIVMENPSNEFVRSFFESEDLI